MYTDGVTYELQGRTERTFISKIIWNWTLVIAKLIVRVYTVMAAGFHAWVNVENNAKMIILESYESILWLFASVSDLTSSLSYVLVAFQYFTDI